MKMHAKPHPFLRTRNLLLTCWTLALLLIATTVAFADDTPSSKRESPAAAEKSGTEKKVESPSSSQTKDQNQDQEQGEESPPSRGKAKASGESGDAPQAGEEEAIILLGDEDSAAGFEAESAPSKPTNSETTPESKESTQKQQGKLGSTAASSETRPATTVKGRSGGKKGTSRGKRTQDMGFGSEVTQLQTLRILGEPLDTSRIASSAHRISKEELEVQGNGDVHRVLAAVPGVYVRGEDGFGLRPNIGLRGVNSDRSSKITLLEDGILFGPAPYSAPAAYYFPAMARITGVDVYKGPASVRFGPRTVGGTLDLQSRPIPQQHEGEIDISAGMYRSGTARGYWGLSTERFGILLEGVHSRSDGFKNLDGENLQSSNTGFAKNDFVAKLRYNSKPTAAIFQSLELKVGYADELSHETYLGLSDADFRADSNRRYAASQLGRMDLWRTVGELRYQVAFSPSVELEAVAYRHDVSRAWRKFNAFTGERDVRGVLLEAETGNNAVFASVLRGDTDSETEAENLLIGTNDRRYVSQGIALEGAWRSAHGWFEHELRFGARYHFDSIERDHIEEEYAMRSGTLLRTEKDLDITADNKGSTHAVALHLQDEMRLGDHLTLVPGMRVELIRTELDRGSEDDSSLFDDTRFDAAFIPGIGAIYQPRDAFSLVTGVHRGFSPVTPGQAPNADPEESVNVEGGVRIHPKKLGANKLHGELMGFFNAYQNFVAECTLSTGCTDLDIGEQVSGGKVFVGGFEAQAAYKRELFRDFEAGAEASYTFTRSSFREDVDSNNSFIGNARKGDELPYLPRHQGALTLLADHPRGYARFTITGFGSMRDQADTRGELPFTDAFARVDVAGGYRPSDHDTIYFKINNLFDNRYIVGRRPFGARPGLPFQLLLGYRHHFGG